MRDRDKLERAVEELQAMVQAQQSELASLRSELRGAPALIRSADEAANRRVSRAGLLKVAAGAAGIAGIGALSQVSPAAAADGSTLLLGSANDANNTESTRTLLSAATGFSGAQLLALDATTNSNAGPTEGMRATGAGTAPGITAIAGGGTAPASTVAAGVYGTGVQYGLYGLATDSVTGNGIGVYGNGSDDGVYGKSTFATGNGVHGDAAGVNGIGVFGTSSDPTGIAVEGQSSRIDVAARGTGILQQNPQTASGAPTTGTHIAGEQIVDKDGNMWVCAAGDGSSLGTWQSIGNLRVFSRAWRVFSTSTAVAGTTYSGVDATMNYQGNHATGVPVGAQAVFAAVQSYHKGVLTLFADGGVDPGIANWSGTASGGGVLNLIYMFIPLSAAAKFAIHTYYSGSIYVDVWGYII